jgi:hypothetical protein
MYFKLSYFVIANSRFVPKLKAKRRLKRTVSLLFMKSIIVTVTTYSHALPERQYFHNRRQVKRSLRIIDGRFHCLKGRTPPAFQADDSRRDFRMSLTCGYENILLSGHYAELATI